MNRFFLIFLVLFFVACNTDTSTEQQKTSPVKKAESNTKQDKEPVSKTKRIVFFGDSLTAGYGLEDSNDAFPGLIQQKIDEMGASYKIVNAGNSGETSAGGLGRIDWILQQPVDIFVLELGANDGLRGLKAEMAYKNLSDIASKVKTKYPNSKLVIAGMEAPPNLGKEYTSEFRSIFPKLANKYDAKLIPFLLDKVAGVESLNQADRIHPTKEGHAILADNVWKILKEIL